MNKSAKPKEKLFANLFKKVTIRMDCEHRLAEAEAAYEAADAAIKSYEYQRYIAAQQVAACKAYLKEHYGNE